MNYKQLKTKLQEAAISPGSKQSKIPSTAMANRNVLQNIRTATQLMKVRGVNPIVAANAHREFAKLVAANPHAPGYMLMKKLAPNKAKAVSDMTNAGIPLGNALEANPNEFRSVISRIKRFK